MSIAATDQLSKVRRYSEGIKVFAQIAAAFWGIGLFVSLLGLALSSSFQLSLGDGELGVTFFSQETSQAVINLYDAKIRFGVNVEVAKPAVRDVTRLVTEPTLRLRVATGALIFLNTAVTLILLQYLAQLFACYAKGEIFTGDVVTRIRKIGYCLAGISGVSMLNSIFGVVLVAALGTATQTSHFSFRIEFFWAALLLILISWIMDVGRALREESELVI